MTRFTDKHAVVTGGTSGIGRATALRLRDEGARVLVTGRDAERLSSIGEADGITAVLDDAAEPDTGQRLRAAVDLHLDGRVDALFLNAGLGAFSPVGGVVSTEVDRQFAINVRGPLLQLAALDSALAPGAAVLFNSSVVNGLMMPGASVYAATKGAVRSAMRSTAGELAARGIRVNAISPGPVDTGFFGATGLGEQELEAFATTVLGQVPLGRFGTADEIAATAAFLLSHEASFVLGHELVVDGGMA
jgi:NAD(P)-dependent dehydrogenase (short-subunit alcohol dehydrogenase family)